LNFCGTGILPVLNFCGTGILPVPSYFDAPQTPNN